MDFKALLARYEQGEATPEEAAIVEEELEKYRLLTDYVVEHDEPELPHAQEEPPEPEILRRVRAAARRQKLGLILGAAMLICVLLLACWRLYRDPILPMLNRVVFLDPNSKTIFGEEVDWTDDLTVATAVFEELYHPGCATVSVGSEITGPWSYDIFVYRYDRRKLNEPAYSMPGTLDKGKFTFPNEFIMSGLAVNDFTRQKGRPREVWDGRAPGRVAEELATLPDYMELCLKLSFARDRSMEELAGLMEEHPEVEVLWAGVRNDLSDRMVDPVPSSGHSPGFSPTGLSFRDPGMEEKYAYLMPYTHQGEDRAAVFTAHFKALLRFQADNGPLMDAVGGVPWTDPRYGPYAEGILKDVEKRGVNTYGIFVAGRPKDLLPLCHLDYVEEVSIDKLTLSLDTGGE